MIQSMWQKKIPFQINISQKDVADQLSPLPLFLEMSWNHYVGIYYDQIQKFYSSWVIYPYQKDQFYLTLQSQNLELNGTQIVGHLVSLYKEGIHNPIKLLCNYRNHNKKPTIQLKKLFKNSLKASACVRNRRFGASILTVQMSVQNVQNMYENYINNDYIKYLGTENFQNQDKGFLFAISKTQKIPVKIIGKDFDIERGVQKNKSLGKFLAQILGQQLLDQERQDYSQKQISSSIQKRDENISVQSSIQTQKQTPQKSYKSQYITIAPQQKKIDYSKYNYVFQKYTIILHGIRISRGQYSMNFFSRFCNPDGWLYLFLLQI